MKRSAILTTLNIAGAALGLAALGLSASLFYEAAQPCGSDGCLVHLAAIPALLLLLFAGPLLWTCGRRLMHRSGTGHGGETKKGGGS